jgi:hypothetical protein
MTSGISPGSSQQPCFSVDAFNVLYPGNAIKSCHFRQVGIFLEAKEPEPHIRPQS